YDPGIWSFCFRCHLRFSLSTLHPCILFFSFFFQSYPDHRDLHSFPTRRSSDLDYAPPIAASGLFWTIPIHPNSVEIKLKSARARSEEHTSELQSHLNLVCRLLLEKKKK